MSRVLECNFSNWRLKLSPLFLTYFKKVLAAGTFFFGQLSNEVEGGSNQNNLTQEGAKP
jgi:hypothetical protein